jgi:hypothetical protein
MGPAVRALATAIGTLVFLVAASPAGADTKRQPVGFPTPNPFELTAPDYCNFNLLVEVVTTNEYFTATQNADGPTTQKFTGSAFVTVTNETTGKTLPYNISGPGTETFYPNGAFTADLAGPELLWTTHANSYDGVPTLSYTTGHVTFSVDQTGKTTAYHLDGHRTDVCAALA